MEGTVEGAAGAGAEALESRGGRGNRRNVQRVREQDTRQRCWAFTSWGKHAHSLHEARDGDRGLVAGLGLTVTPALAAAPSNDTIGGAVPITALPFDTSVNTS